MVARSSDWYVKSPFPTKVAFELMPFLALARAVYARKPIVLLDDVMSALDARTEKAVFQSLLADNGLLRQGGTTVLMITNSAHHLSLADEIVFLGADGDVKHYDSFDELRPDILETLGLAKGAVHCEDSSKTTGPSLPKRGGREMKSKTQQEEVKKKEKERARRTGDLRCYVTYGASMGWIRAGLFFAIAIMFAALSRAACKFFTPRTKNKRG